MSRIFLAFKRINPSFLLVLAVLGLLMTHLEPAQAQTLTTLYSFAGPPDDGYVPDAGVILDSQGNLYGTTQGRGMRGCHQVNHTCGTIFKLTQEGAETTLHAFHAATHAYPMAGLIFDAKGNLYGTTHGSGGHRLLDGSVFRLNPQNRMKTLHRFRYAWMHPYDGAFPVAGVIMDAQGNLYGTTSAGGGVYYPYGVGIVFELSASGSETILYNFCSQPGCSDGFLPYSALIMDNDGNLYGTTAAGGTGGGGTVFRLTPSGTETTLYGFCSEPNCADGAQPYATLIMDAQGNLYGTTSGGGTAGNGTVFMLTPSGTETVLYNFCSQTGCIDGAYPVAGLVRDAHGNLYGTTSYGGLDAGFCAQLGCGTIFAVTPSGTHTVLYSFCSQANCADGAYPVSSLTIDANGNLYGTTPSGGASNYGTVFKLTP